ncbi:MAG: hypothetical protein KDD70_10075 [Bdellovibrionales bacterium]|nr:hypothetical protein [Bdellovibrionales bacterium]
MEESFGFVGNPSGIQEIFCPIESSQRNVSKAVMTTPDSNPKMVPDRGMPVLLPETLSEGGVSPTLPLLESHPAIPSEYYCGSREDREFIRDWLNARRQLAVTPEYITAQYEKRIPPGSELDIVVVGNLGDIFGPDGRTEDLKLNRELFAAITGSVARSLREITPSIELIPLERYWVAAVNEGSSDSGGFHSKHGMGYQYIDDYAASVLLADSITEDTLLKTLELARNYLHDSLHRSTFRSFKVVGPEERAEAQEDWPVFRHQYGINFRREDGISYSPAASNQPPYSLNLNLLMDGTVVLAVADAVRNQMAGRVRQDARNEVHVAREVLFPELAQQFLPEAEKFQREVTAKTAAFLQYWGGDDFRGLLLSAMMSGDLRGLIATFSEKAERRRDEDPGFKEFLVGRAEAHGLPADFVSSHLPGRNLWNLTFLSPDYHQLTK